MLSATLYRKYRPSNWSEVVGQEAVVEGLSASLKLGRISHAYLFSGSRGTGKTSVARIFARELGVGVHDTYEIDAASNTGVDDVRALNESVRVLPFESKYKVYIIDEVHMLSKSAFNALLKTLEEPPAHVVFILATTEAAKLPETVVSRCQTFEFRKPSLPIIAKLIADVAKKEGFSLEPSSAELVALLSDGSFRDAYGILQKVITTSSDKKISAEEVERIAGAPRGAIIDKFIVGIDERDSNKALEAVAEAGKNNVDMKAFLKLALRKIRFVLLLKYAKDLKERIASEVPKQELELLQKLAAKTDSGISSAAVLELLNAYDHLGFSSIPELPIELAVMKITNLSAIFGAGSKK